MAGRAIDNKTKQPLYVSIKEYLKKEIDNSNLRPGVPIPTEKWICEHFNVSRVTVRKAIDDLVNERVIERKRGKSPTVPVRAVQWNLNHLTGMSEQIANDGHIASAKVVFFGYVKPPVLVAEEMKINSSEKVVLIDRTRLSDGKPIVIQSIYLNPKYAKGLVEKDLYNESLYLVLEKKGVQIDWGTQEVYARLPSKEQASRLEIDTHTPVLYLHRLSYVKNGDVLEYVQAYCDSNRYSLEMKLNR